MPALVTGPTTELLYSIANHLLALCAVVYGSHIALRRWIAVRSLRTPTVRLDIVSSLGSPTERHPLEQRRYANIKVLRPIGLTLFFLILQIGGIFALSRLTSVKKLDLAWTAILFGMQYSAAERAFTLVWPSTTIVRYKQDENSPATRLKFDTENLDHYPQIIAALFSATILSTSAMDIRLVQPIVVALFTLNAFGAVRVSKWSVKRSVMWLNGVLLGLGLVVGIAVTLLGLRPVGRGTRNPPFSPWLDRLVMALGIAVPFMASGTHVALALKYDYVASQANVQTHPPGDSAEVSRRAPTFSKPTFQAAVAGLIVTTTSLDICTYRYPQLFDDFQAIEASWTILSLPIVTLCTFWSVRRRGRTAEFWRYEERWWWNSKEARELARASETDSRGASSEYGAVTGNEVTQTRM